MIVSLQVTHHGTLRRLFHYFGFFVENETYIVMEKSSITEAIDAAQVEFMIFLFRVAQIKL